MNLSVELAPNNKNGLLLKNPVMSASGTFGYGAEYAGLVDVARLGAVVVKGTTLRPRSGNPQPRQTETPAGMLNSVGLENPGVRAVVKKYAPLWKKWPTPVIVNVAGETVDEYAEVASILEGVDGVAGLEINVSCPNVAAGGMQFGKDPHAAAEVTRAVRKATTLPVIIKLSPNVSDIGEIAAAVVEAGADAVSLINTLSGMKIDVSRRKPFLGGVSGGLSGPAIRPVAVYQVYEVAKVVNVPVVGIGGIADTNDALEFLMAGASAVQVGTASFVNPLAMVEVIEGLEQFLQQEGLADINEIIGAAQLMSF